ncbi:Cell division protein ZipA [hydrothermal vent metagenome]|uniref:Cell division protein ZipA n=1 Tax=hydrothermal vent metagenome TaxID=652676 RepID=A0A3B0WP85_9ZZZZ
MNELQQVLLIFAVVVVIALYFLSRNRQPEQKKEHTKSQEAESSASYQKASHALNDLGEPHIPLSKNTEARLTQQDEERVEVNEYQAVLPFGDEFVVPEQGEQAKPVANRSEDVSAINMEATIQENDTLSGTSQLHDEVTNIPDANNQNTTGGKHHVLEVDDLGVTGEGYQYVAPEYEKPSFGMPEAGSSAPATESHHAEKKEAQVFVILVMSTAQEFSMMDVNQALLGVGLSFIAENNFFVKMDNMGNHFIKVANLMEPGTFPVESMENHTTSGVVMILELPTTVKAPAAMHDLIMMARKVSQRLQGRLYNMERQLLKESDLQNMREEAVKYESEPL